MPVHAARIRAYQQAVQALLDKRANLEDVFLRITGRRIRE